MGGVANCLCAHKKGNSDIHFPNLEETKEINIKTTLQWAYKQFSTTQHVSAVEYRICSQQCYQFITCYWCVVINPFLIDKLIRKCIRFANECYISMLKWVIQFPIVPHICVSESGQHWFRLCLVAYSAPRDCLNHCWVIVSWALGNTLQWHFDKGGRQHLEW